MGWGYPGTKLDKIHLKAIQEQISESSRASDSLPADVVVPSTIRSHHEQNGDGDDDAVDHHADIGDALADDFPHPPPIWANNDCINFICKKGRKRGIGKTVTRNKNATFAKADKPETRSQLVDNYSVFKNGFIIKCGNDSCRHNVMDTRSKIQMHAKKTGGNYREHVQTLIYKY